MHAVTILTMAGLPNRRADGKTLLREMCFLAPPGSPKVLLGEAVTGAGLDPEVFCAVIPADCGVAGVVNANNRVYDITEAVDQHSQLCEAAASQVIVGEQGHPESSESWATLTRFLGGASKVLESGAVALSGSFALLNNSLGRDMLVNWRAGIPIGVSARGYGVLSEHTIDADSPYAAMNPTMKGRKVKRVTEYELEAYDWVRVPSAGTYIDSPATVTAPTGAAESGPEVKRALRRLREAQQQESPMFKDLAEFKAAHPELSEELAALMLTEARKQVVEQVTGAKVNPAAAATAAPEVRELIEQQATDRARVQALEAERVKDAARFEEVKTLATEAANTAKAWEVKAVKAELRGAVLTECDSLAKGNPAGALIKGKIMARFDAGKIATVDEAKAEWADLAEFAKSSATANGAPPPAKVDEAAPGGLDPATGKGGTGGLASLHQRLAEV